MPYLTGNSGPSTYDCFRVTVPNDLYFRLAFKGALLTLTDPDQWEEFGTGTAAEMAALAQEMYDALELIDCD